MRDRLFTIIDGEPIINAPLVNLNAFKKLWDSDSSDDKTNFKKWMLYIYYMCDYRSSFFEVKNKKEKVSKEVWGRTKITVPKKVEACIKEYKKRVPVEQRTLETLIASTDSINDTLTTMQAEAGQLTELIEVLEKEIKVAMDLKEIHKATDLMKSKLDLQGTQLDIIGKISGMVAKIEKNVVSIANTRESMERAYSNYEDSGDRLEDYIIDSFIAMRTRGDIISNIE